MTEVRGCHFKAWLHRGGAVCAICPLLLVSQLPCPERVGCRVVSCPVKGPTWRELSKASSQQPDTHVVPQSSSHRRRVLPTATHPSPGDTFHQAAAPAYTWFMFSTVSIVALWASPVALVVKNPPASAGDLGSIPGSGRSPGVGHGNLLLYSCLENPMERGAWRATVHRVRKSQTQLT